MASEAEIERAQARRGRMVGLVIAVAILLWLGAQIVGPMAGLPGRYALLFDFAALAAMFWALVVTAQMWRARKSVRAEDKG
ncbi:DUF5337 domain-containing protein [Sulfitobacter sp. LCG007]